MELEKIKKDQKKKYMIASLVIITLIITITFIATRANWKSTSSIPLASGTIYYYPSDFELASIKLQSNGEYIDTDTVPTSGYELNTELSVCKVKEEKQDVTITYENGKVNVSNITKRGNKCELYFDVKATPFKEAILANNTTDTSRRDGHFESSFEEDTVGKIFQATDEDGATYFFAGTNPSNWVSFAGYYWRIIRINGDGSIRIIYNGITTAQTGESTQIGTKEYNENERANTGIGYMYGFYSKYVEKTTVGGRRESGSSLSTNVTYSDSYTFDEKTGRFSLTGTLNVGSAYDSLMHQYTCMNNDLSCSTLYNFNRIDTVTSGSSGSTNTFYIADIITSNLLQNYEITHANMNSSKVKSYLDTWYEENLKESYGSYIDTNAGFCGDRTIDTTTWPGYGYTGDGTGIQKTLYAPRVRASSSHVATYQCSNSNDLYTANSSTKGNKALTYPIGLITIDETMFAGSSQRVSNYWLKTELDYWTMSPDNFSGDYAYISSMNSYGQVSDSSATTLNGVRPVINLKVDTLVTGSGTTLDPYRVV